MACIAIVPARLDSTRFPGKLLSTLAGRPLIDHVVRRCLAMPGIDETIVATDDERIADAARRAGAGAVITRGRFASGTDRVAAVAADHDAELVVNVQGDEVFLDPEAAGAALRRFRSDGHEFGTLRAPLVEPADLWNPDVVKVVVDAGGRALYFSRAPVPFPCSLWRRSRRDIDAVLEFDTEPDLSGPFWMHLGVYFYRSAALQRWAGLPPSPLEETERLEQLRIMEAGGVLQTYLVPGGAPAVNSPADLERARAALAAHETEH